jgi:hypothetical protein
MKLTVGDVLLWNLRSYRKIMEIEYALFLLFSYCDIVTYI